MHYTFQGMQEFTTASGDQRKGGVRLIASALPSAEAWCGWSPLLQVDASGDLGNSVQLFGMASADISKQYYGFTGIKCTTILNN
jgi:hypothetical protein